MQLEQKISLTSHCSVTGGEADVVHSQIQIASLENDPRLLRDLGYPLNLTKLFGKRAYSKLTDETDGNDMWENFLYNNIIRFLDID
jgi:hypothetical protein